MAWPLPPLMPNFEAALRDVRAERPESRMAAAERLGHAKDGERPQALAPLVSLTRDEHPDVRATAITAIGMLGDGAGLDTVLAHLEDDNHAVREFAALAVAQIGGPRALEALRGALTSETPAVRFQAVAAVAELDREHAAKDVVPLLADPDHEVRGQAVAALASLEAPHLCGHLAGMLDDSSRVVRLESALALAGLGDARGERVLLEALVLRERLYEVAPALASLGSQNARDTLARIAASFFGAPHTRAVTAAALVRMGDERGVPALRRVLRGLRSDARSYAVELAGQERAEPLVDDLVRFVDRPRGVDPVTLVGALAQFPRSEAARSALARLSQRDGDVGSAAKAALDAATAAS